MKAQWFNGRAAALVIIGLLLVTVLGTATPARAQVGTYVMRLVPNQTYVIQRGADHAVILYSPPNPDPMVVSMGHDRPGIRINCSRDTMRWMPYGTKSIRADLDAAGSASIVGTRLGAFELRLLDYGAGARDARQWVVTFPVEGNNQTPPRTCG